MKIKLIMMKMYQKLYMKINNKPKLIKMKKIKKI